MPTLSEAWAKYERKMLHLHRQSPNTVKNYRSTVHKFIDHVGDKDVSEITEEDIEEFLIELGVSGASEASLRRHYYALKAFLMDAGARIEWRTFKLPQPKLIRFKVLSEDEVKRVIKVAGQIDKKYGLMLWLAYEAALRISELCSLKVDNLDFDRCMVFVQRTKREEGREIPLTEELCLELKNYVIMEDKKPGEYLFTTKFGNPWKPDTFRKVVWQRVAELAGINARYHDFARHSRATNMLRRGVDIYTVNKILGHKILQTTMIYLHLVGEELRERLGGGP